jgi:hypothetical protein
MTDDEYEREQAAKDLARQRVGFSATGVGAAYLGRADRDPRFAPPPGWRGVVVVSDGSDSLVHLLVTAESKPRHADVDPDALAAAIEALAASGGIEHLRRLTQEGPGLRLEAHAQNALPSIFG